MSIKSGDEIPIENRNMEEVLDIQVKGEEAAPKGAKARNPAFDITPNRLLTGLITEKGVVYPPFRINLSRLMRQSLRS
jgi:methylthioribose-1-phosphate isomerase